jgi:MFS family permease
MTLSFLPAGYLSDHIGRRPLIRLAWLMGSTATAIMAFAHSLPIFVIGMVLYNMTGFVTVPLNSYITAAHSRWSVRRTLTLVSASFSLGYILGPLIGGWIGEQSGLQTNFRIAAFFFVVSTLIILFIHRQPVEAHPEGGGWPALASLRNKPYLRYVALMLFIMLGLYLPQPLTPNFLQNLHGIDLLQMGQLISARSLGVVILNLALGQLNARLGFPLAQVSVALFALLIWQGNGFPVYLLGFLMVGGYTTARGLATAQGRALVQAANMGLAYGLLETMAAFGMVLGAPLAGFLYELNPQWIYITSLVLIALGMCAYLFLSPLRRKDLIAFEEKDKAKWTQS